VTELRILRLPHGEGLPTPAYETSAAAGLDLPAAVPAAAPIVIGLVLQFPIGFEAQVRPRSGLALRHGVTVLNAPGTIDADYRGELKVLLVNHGDEPFVVTRGARIAQLVLAPVARATVVEAEAVDPSGRGEGGFGSTGR